MTGGQLTGPQMSGFMLISGTRPEAALVADPVSSAPSANGPAANGRVAPANDQAEDRQPAPTATVPDPVGGSDNQES